MAGPLALNLSGGRATQAVGLGWGNEWPAGPEEAGAARLCRYAVPSAGMGVPFQGGERWVEVVLLRVQWGRRRQWDQRGNT